MTLSEDHTLMILRAAGVSGHDPTDSPFETALRRNAMALASRGLARIEQGKIYLTVEGLEMSVSGWGTPQHKAEVR